MNTKARVFPILGAVAALATLISVLGGAGCGAEAPADAEPVGEATEPLCSVGTPDCIISGSGACTSGSSYGHSWCSDEYVVNVTNLNVTNAPNSPAGIWQTWADTEPTSAGTCAAAELCASMYTWGPTGFVYNAQRCAHGVWINLGAGPFCAGPTVSWLESDGTTTQGYTYRFAVEALDAAGAQKKVEVYTLNGNP
jgi:hypothetical protein